MRAVFGLSYSVRLSTRRSCAEAGVEVLTIGLTIPEKLLQGAVKWMETVKTTELLKKAGC
jgi:hypothetical protein